MFMEIGTVAMLRSPASATRATNHSRQNRKQFRHTEDIWVKARRVTGHRKLPSSMKVKHHKMVVDPLSTF